MAVNAENLVAARKAKRWSQSDLAVNAKVSQQTIGKLETGAARTTKFIAKIASALDVEIGYLDPDFGNLLIAKDGPLHYRPLPVIVDEVNRIPLFASAEGSNGTGSLIITTEPMEYVPRPYTLESVKGAYAIVIEGESMVPAYEPGDMAWVNPMQQGRRDHDVIVYGGDASGDIRAMIKRMVSYTDQDWTLKQYNPAQTFKLSRSSWGVCHRVVGKLSKR